MKIAEALIKLKDLKSEKVALIAEFTESIYILPEDEGKCKTPEQILPLIDAIQKEIKYISLDITKANLSSGVLDKLKECEGIKLLISNYETILSKITSKDARFLRIGRFMDETNKELRINTTLSPEFLKQQIKDYRQTLRKLESDIAYINWNQEI